MNTLKQLIAFCFVVSGVSASSCMSHLPASLRDTYGGLVPSPTVVNGVHYTTTAIQGMISHHLSYEEIGLALANHCDDLGTSRVIHDRNIAVIVSETSTKDNIEVTSVWKN